MRFGSFSWAAVALLACSEAGLAAFTVSDRAWLSHLSGT